MKFTYLTYFQLMIDHYISFTLHIHLHSETAETGSSDMLFIRYMSQTWITMPLLPCFLLLLTFISSILHIWSQNFGIRFVVVLSKTYWNQLFDTENTQMFIFMFSVDYMISYNNYQTFIFKPMKYEQILYSMFI